MPGSPSQPPHRPDPGHPGVSPPPPEDADLIARLRTEGVGRSEGGEPGQVVPSTALCGELIRRHQDRLFAICMRMVGRNDAADVCQTALVRIIQGLPSFDARSQLSTWLVRITMNTCFSHLRAAKLRRHRSLPEESDFDRDLPVSNREPDGASSVQREESLSRLEGALSALDADQRAILVLRDVRGLDYERIAAVMGIAEGTVKSRLFRAREALRKAIESGKSSGSRQKER